MTHALRSLVRLGLGAFLLFVAGTAMARPTFTDRIISSDEFDIYILDSYTDLWDDQGSGARRDVTILKPEPPTGFYILGHIAVPRYDVLTGSEKPYTIAIRPRPGFENLLRQPDRFEWVYDDAGTGANRNLAIYRARCADGYVALGAIAHAGGTDTPGDPNFRCIRRTALVQAAWNPVSIWDDADSGGDHGVGLWASTYTGRRPADRMIMVSNAFWPTADAAEPNGREAWAISFKFENLPNPAAELTRSQVAGLTRPILTGPEPPGTLAVLPTIEYQVPFFVVDDPEYDQVEQWVRSPYYTIVRTVSLTYVTELDNTDCTVQGNDSDTFHHTQSVGIEDETSWAVGLGLTVGVTRGLEVEGTPLGVGVSTNVSFTTEFSATWEHGGSRTRSTSSEQEWEHPVPKGTYSALFVRTSRYVVLRGDGTTVAGSTNSFTDATPVFVDWAPAGWSAANPCGAGATTPTGATPSASTGAAGAFPISGTTELVRGRRYASASGGHYLLFQDDGNLVVYTAAGGYVWGLNQLVSDLGQVGRITMQSDGNLVASTAAGGYVWSALHEAQPAGTTLTLSPTGVLQITRANGIAAWSSTP